jgi:fumarate reductase flavoprotein subunit
VGGTSASLDLVVIGGGMAGMIAGVRAAQLGLSVAVLEQGTGDRYLCNARYSGGIFHLAYNDVKVPEATLLEAMQASTAGAIDPALAKVLAARGGELVDWLAKQGARFIRPGLPWQNWTLAPPRPLSAGLEWVGRGPDVMLRRLGQTLASAGGTLHLGTRATALRMQDGRCVGVDAVRDGASIALTAGAVLIADGGFQGDLSLVGEHIARAPEKLKQRGASTGTGTGLRMAEAVGGATTRLDRFYGHMLSRDAMHNDRVWPYPEVDAVAASGVLLDETGRRFADEGMGGIYLANEVARLENPLGTVLIFDSPIWEGPGRSARIPANPQLERAGATLHKGGDIATVAKAAGLPADAVLATVADYNQALRNNTLSALTPARTGFKHAPMPIETAPFYALPACAGITYTMGGLRIDADARVLSREGGPIPGLYAAGSTTGGVEGGDVAGYVGGLAKAGVFALCAAEHVARARNGEG